MEGELTGLLVNPLILLKYLSLNHFNHIKEVQMYKRYFLFLVLSVFVSLSVSSTNAQQILDSANVLYIDNTSDNNIGAIGSLMNDARYREFPQSINAGTDYYGFWSNNSTVYWGGHYRR